MENATDKQIAFLAKNNVDAKQMTKQEAHQLIANIFTNAVKPEDPIVKPEGVHHPFVNKNSQSSFYVAYAKDLFIAIYEKNPLDSTSDLMQRCIDMIKLAKEQL